jgi:hypothetical protein
MKTGFQHIKFRKSIVSCMSMALIAVFIVLGILAQRGNVSKRSGLQVVEKSKKTQTENDFLLFEEDNELSDKNENNSEWNKDLSFPPLAAILPSTIAPRHTGSCNDAFHCHPRTLYLTPIYIRIRVLRI